MKNILFLLFLIVGINLSFNLAYALDCTSNQYPCRTCDTNHGADSCHYGVCFAGDSCNLIDDDNDGVADRCGCEPIIKPAPPDDTTTIP